jgi:hypothetical protein
MARIYDVSEICELAPSLLIDNYDDYIAFFLEIGEEWFRNHNIYCEKHHIKPRCEGGKDNENNLVSLPYTCHMRAHFLKAKQWDELNRPDMVRKHLYAIQANFTQMFQNLQLTEILLTIPGLLKCAAEARKNGFIEQFKPKKRAANLGKVCIHKGSTNKYVDKSELKQFQQRGWKLGRLKKRK